MRRHTAVKTDTTCAYMMRDCDVESLIEIDEPRRDELYCIEIVYSMCLCSSPQGHSCIVKVDLP